MKPFWFVLSSAASALAASRTSAPPGCITVGSGGFGTIQAAVNSLSTTAGGTQCIFIQPGTYREQVLVSSRAAQLTIYGYTTDDRSYANNAATIIQNKSQANTGGNNDSTGTLRVKAKGFRLYNVNVVNDYGEGSQAIALSAYADSGYYGNTFRGFQDTVLSNEGRQVYVRNQIIGATDFIFGQRARSWFERSDIRVVAKSLGYITANGRETNDNAGSYYVFNSCDIAGTSGSVPAGAYYLGRPWREFSRVVFQRTSMSNVVNQAGWRDWSSNGAPPGTVFYGEFSNSGAGSNINARPSTIKRLGSAITIQEVLGNDYASQSFFDQAYFSG
jgi:pectinesterase